MGALSNYGENKVLDCLRGGGAGTSITAPSALYAQVHIGDPGEDGTSNVAATTTRAEVQFGAASSGVVTMSNSPSFTAAADETWTHISIWDASSSGNCWWQGALARNKSVLTSNSYSLAALTCALD